MASSIDYTSEAAVTDIFTDENFTDELHRYLGLDPALAAANQPTDVDDLLHTVIHLVEGDQWRFILEKPVTLKLPYEALKAKDCKIYLPYGSVSALTTFSYIDTNGDTQNVSSSDYTLESNAPAFLFKDNWFDIIEPHPDEPLPITITYTTGYDSFNKIPRGTLHAIKLMAYHHFNCRGDEDKGIPVAYSHHVSQDGLYNRRCLEFIS